MVGLLRNGQAVNQKPLLVYAFYILPDALIQAEDIRNAEGVQLLPALEANQIFSGARDSPNLITAWHDLSFWTSLFHLNRWQRK